MNPEDFDFDDYMENSGREFEMKLEEYKSRMMAQAIEANYENIKNNGINEYHLRHLNTGEVLALKETFETMIQYFVELEEYEKCAVIQKEQEKINSIFVNK